MRNITDTLDEVSIGNIMKKKDKWCLALKREGKPTISGGAARNVRISESGGMDNIVLNAVEFAINRANLLAGSVANRGTSSQPTERNEVPPLH
jgi:hypothetical protein